MAISAKQRWSIYAVAGVLTLLAMRWAGSLSGAELASSEIAAIAERPQQMQRVEAPAVSTEPATSVHLERLAPRIATPAVGNPFGTRVREDAEHRPVAPAKPPPPQAPPLTFSYLGKWIENGTTTVYLSRQRRNYLARVGESLADEYTVVAIEENQIILNYVPLGIKQALPLSSRTVNTAPTGRSAPEPSEPEEQDE